jgi:uncharacterized membrane protein YphA (DoxX/SURF4 family)
MAYGDRPIGMEKPAQWLAFLRIVVGAWFAKSIFTKLSIALLGGFIPVPVTSARWIATMPKIVAKQASENPILWYKSFLDHTVLTHAPLFAHLTAWGEVIFGLGLLLGLANGISSLGLLWLVINYGLATWWISPANQGFHTMLFSMLLAFYFARAGRDLGLDGVIMRSNPRSWWAKRPIS